MRNKKVTFLIIMLITMFAICMLTYIIINNINMKKAEEALVKRPPVESIEKSKIEAAQPVVKEYVTEDGKKYEIIAILRIPSLDIEYPVLSETSEELLKISLNKYWGSNPNEVGNFCIIGHNYYNKKFFSRLPEIKNGDKVILTDMNNKTLEYIIYDKFIVDPDDTTCTSQLTNGNKELTLITCCNYSTQRFIAKAKAK